MKVWNEFTAEELEHQYNMRLARSDYETGVIPDWMEQSARVRDTLSCQLDLPYGAGERERLDFFPVAQPASAPVLIYFHGGYWQRGDKSVYSFLARPFVENGVSVILVNYNLCPTVALHEITAQARRAVAWVWHNAGKLGIPADQIHVMGHSAGGHLTGMMMATDWTALDPRLPRDVVKSGIPISGLFELEPLRFTTINNAVGLGQEQAEDQSPINHPPATDAPQLVVCGGAEPSEFHRQSDDYVRRFSTDTRVMGRYTVPGCDHFDEIYQLGDAESEFFQQALALIRSARQG